MKQKPKLWPNVYCILFQDVRVVLCHDFAMNQLMTNILNKNDPTLGRKVFQLKQASRARTSNYIPQYIMWDVITYFPAVIPASGTIPTYTYIYIYIYTHIYIYITMDRWIDITCINYWLQHIFKIITPIKLNHIPYFNVFLKKCIYILSNWNITCRIQAEHENSDIPITSSQERQRSNEFWQPQAHYEKKISN